jgi:hypothetical protein
VGPKLGAIMVIHLIISFFGAEAKHQEDMDIEDDMWVLNWDAASLIPYPHLMPPPVTWHTLHRKVDRQLI